MKFTDPTWAEIREEWSTTYFEEDTLGRNKEIENELKKQYETQGKSVEKRPKTKRTLQNHTRLKRKDRKPVKCERCGHIWAPKVLDPKVCQKCLSYKWKSPKPEKANKKAYEGYKNFKIKNEKIILMHKGGKYEIQTKTLETKEKLLSLMRQLLGKKWVTRKHLWCLVVFCEDKFGYNCYEKEVKAKMEKNMAEITNKT